MFELPELMEGARNCVVGYTGVSKGENVLIWTDRSGDVDPLVVQAISLAVEEAEADLTIINSNPPIFRLGEKLSGPVKKALQDADAIIHIFQLENAASIDNRDIHWIVKEYDTRITAVIAITAELLASEWARYPIELYSAIWTKSAEKSKDAPFKLTDPNGSNLTGRFKPWPMGGLSAQGIPQGGWTFFPGGEIALHPESPVNGTVVFELFEGISDLLKEPVKLTVEDHWITKVEGGPEAKWYDKMMKKYKNGYYFSEVTWGIHPKSPLWIGLQQKAQDTITFRHAGTFHCGNGLWTCQGIISDFHWDGGGLHPTLWIGDELIVDNGRVCVLDDPEIRELAKKYGDPDELLTEARKPWSYSTMVK